MTPALRRLTVRVLLPLFALCVVVAALWLARDQLAPTVDGLRPRGRADRTVEVPVSAPPFDRRDALYVVATVRWGLTSANEREPSTASGGAVVWDGFAALDCGSVEGADAIALEPLASSDGRASGGDRLGPVVLADSGEARVYWRSATRGDWDGVRLHLAACKPTRPKGAAATLRIVTARKTWAVQLVANLDAFVSVPVGPGQVIDVHLATVKDVEALQRARISVAPLPPEPASPLAIETPPAPAEPPHL